MPPHPLTNFEIQKYYKNELRFNDFILAGKKLTDDTNLFSPYDF